MKAICIQKYRDRQGVIEGYDLKMENGQVHNYNPAMLKHLMKNGTIEVNNLRLTSDGRLIDKKEVVAPSKNKVDWEKAKVAFDKMLATLRKYYPYEVHGLNYNDGAVNYADNGEVYFTAEYECKQYGENVTVEFWVNFRRKDIEMCTDITVGEDGSLKVRAESFTEKGIKDMIDKFLSECKL